MHGSMPVAGQVQSSCLSHTRMQSSALGQQGKPVHTMKLVFSCSLATSPRAASFWDVVVACRGLARSCAVSAMTCVAVCRAASKPSYLTTGPSQCLLADAASCRCGLPSRGCRGSIPLRTQLGPALEPEHQHDISICSWLAGLAGRCGTASRAVLRCLRAAQHT